MSNFNYHFPCASGVQAGRVFYNMCMPMRTLVRLLRLDNGAIEQRSQRLVNESRASKVAKYILDNRETFVIPSLTGVIEVPQDSDFRFDESTPTSMVGTLVVPMDSSLKLFDGQHRAMGIAKALEADSTLSSQMVPVMVFVNMTLAERRLAFTDINQNVSKPAQSISDTFNSRDPLPAFTVELANELNCFKGLVDFERNTVTKTSPYLFPLKALKEATATLMGCGANPTELTDDQKQFARDAWTALSESMEWGGNFLGNKDAATFREGTIKTHVVMVKAMALAVKHIAANQSGRLDLSGLATLNFDRVGGDFTRRCVQPETGNMISNSKAVQLTANKLIQACGVVLDSTARQIEDAFFTPEVPEVLTVAQLVEDNVTLALNAEYGGSTEMLAEMIEKYEQVCAEQKLSLSFERDSGAHRYHHEVIAAVMKSGVASMTNIRKVRAAFSNAKAKANQ